MFALLLFLLQQRTRIPVNLLGITVPLLQTTAIKHYHNKFPTHDPVGSTQAGTRAWGDACLDTDAVPYMEQVFVRVFPLNLPELWGIFTWSWPSLYFWPCRCRLSS